MLRTAFLWIHVFCGAIWVAVSLSFVLAAGASTETERAGFAARVAPVLNRLNLAAIALLPLSGIANLIFVARERHFRLPAAFVEVLSAKVAAALRDGGRVDACMGNGGAAWLGRSRRRRAAAPVALWRDGRDGRGRADARFVAGGKRIRFEGRGRW